MVSNVFQTKIHLASVYIGLYASTCAVVVQPCHCQLGPLASVDTRVLWPPVTPEPVL